MASPTKPLPPRLAVPLALAFAFATDSLSPSSTTTLAFPSKAVSAHPTLGRPNATYGYLPAPRWGWEEMPPAPVSRLDGASVQIGDLLYVFAGYESLDHVHSHVDVYNFTSNTWTGRFHMPKDMSNSHLGMASEGRYIYAVTGQFGPQCWPAVNRNLVADTKTKEWGELPPLPIPRYAPATQLWRGRLHVMVGGKEDRHEP